MIIVKYESCGMKSVVEDDATSEDLEALHTKWKKKEHDDDCFYVDWLDEMSFEVTHDEWASGLIFRLRPDNWPITNGEPQ
jgi:hypothetical protein